MSEQLVHAIADMREEEALSLVRDMVKLSLIHISEPTRPY